MVLNDTTVFALGLLHEHGEFLDTARQHGQFIVAGIVEFDRQTLRVFLVLHLVGEQLDAADNRAIDHQEHDEQHEPSGQSQTDNKDAHRQLARLEERA